MTDTSVPHIQADQNGSEDQSRTTRVSTSETVAVLWPKKSIGVRRTSEAIGTGDKMETIAGGEILKAPVERIYPHAFDDSDMAGQARVFVLKALEDARLALESFGEADLGSIGTRLSLIAAAMNSAHPLTEFNENLGAVVSFIRRAMLTMSGSDTTRPALNALVHVLQSLSLNPMIDLDDASDLVDKLVNEGWRGEHGIADELVAALFADSDAEVHAETLKQSIVDR